MHAASTTLDIKSREEGRIVGLRDSTMTNTAVEVTVFERARTKIIYIIQRNALRTNTGAESSRIIKRFT